MKASAIQAMIGKSTVERIDPERERGATTFLRVRQLGAKRGELVGTIPVLKRGDC